MFDVITIGSATRDALFKSQEFKIIKNENFITGKALAINLGSKIKINEIFFSTGGAATNSAVAFSRQGLKTAAIFRIGDDLSGKTIKEEMLKEKIDVSFVQNDNKLNTAYSVILEHESGERTVLAYRGANENLDWREIPWNEIRTKWFYLTSLSGDLNILKNVINHKEKNGALIAWNPGGSDLKLGLKKLFPYLKSIDVFLVNQEEAAGLLKIPYAKTDLIFKKFDEIIKGVAVMTAGPKGLIISDGKNIFKAGVFKEKKVVDRTGAGDAFGSGFVAGLIRKNYNPKMPPEVGRECVKFAINLGSANATSKVENLGAKGGLLTREEFEKSARFKNLPIEIASLY